MIKSIFLNQRLKQNRKPQEHETYATAKSIGVLFNADQFDVKIVSSLVEDLKGDSKKVAQLGFTKTINEQSKEDKGLFSKKDISNTGGIKKTGVHDFIREQFDFLISLDNSADINFKYILAACNATCKIGFDNDEYQNLLLMTMKLKDDKTQSVKDLISYLKKI